VAKYFNWTGQEKLRWLITVITAFGVTTGLWLGPLSVEASSLLLPFIITIALSLLGLWYRQMRHDEKLASLLIATGQLTGFGALTALLNYTLIGLDRPFIDGLLAQWDALYGFYWPEVVQIQQSYPLLDGLLTLAYISSLPQLAIVILVLGFYGQFLALERFMLAFMLLVLATVIFWGFFPSFGSASYYYELGVVTDFAGLAVEKNYIEAMLALKNGTLTHASLSEIKGVVAFPSFHTVMAILSVYAMASVKGWFWPFFILNILVVLSVPVDGGHHIVDIGAGMALALAGLKLVEYILPEAKRSKNEIPSKILYE
jgi:hypothetical protein